MLSSTLPDREVKKWRVLVFTIVAGLLLLLALFFGVFDLLLMDGQSGFSSDIHRWHEAQSGAWTVILVGGSLFALLWQPQRKPLLVVFLVLSIALFSLCFATVTGSGFIPIALAAGTVFICFLIAVYPKPHALLHFKREGSPSYPLLVLTFIAAALLAPIIARELNWQILGMTGQDVHALNYHWLTSVVVALMLILAGSLSATKRAGWQVLGCIEGVAFLYLGSVALILPDYAGSWGITGGVLGVIGGIGYISVVCVEIWKTRKAAQVQGGAE